MKVDDENCSLRLIRILFNLGTCGATLDDHRNPVVTEVLAPLHKWQNFKWYTVYLWQWPSGVVLSDQWSSYLGPISSPIQRDDRLGRTLGQHKLWYSIYGQAASANAWMVGLVFWWAQGSSKISNRPLTVGKRGSSQPRTNPLSTNQWSLRL